MPEAAPPPELEAVRREGIIFIGDPHVASYPPGHRLDDYTAAVLGKLRFCLDSAREQALLPIILGDLFHAPRSNPNYILVELIEMFRPARPWVLVGNHDKHEARLTRDVSLAVLEAAGAIKLLGEQGPAGILIAGGRRILIGASPDWTPLPTEVDRGDFDFVVWTAHHDLQFPGYENGRVRLKEIRGVDMVVNGHIHTPKPPQRTGATLWCNPGGIARMTRSVTTRGIRPAASIWRPGQEGLERLEIPHRPFDEVFPPLTGDAVEGGADDGLPVDESLFIKGLENLALRKTTEGVGLKTFLDANLDKGDPVDQIIWELYEEVMHDESD